MITLSEPRHLSAPTTAVRASYLSGERANAVEQRADTHWLGPASDDFAAFVAARREVTIRWGRRGEAAS